ncbi:MAG TPA: hypothetical protein VFI29_00295 [Hanamia sp.]|nr:hypothetical protein [Hanamia sp.]
MNRNLYFNLIVALLISFSVSAQKNKVHFHSINSFGLIGGETETGIAFQTINGIRFSNWFSGIGVGIDNYEYKTLPLFFDARWYFGSEKKAFVYGDLGYNFPMKNKPGKEMVYYDNYHFKGGLYSELGIGFKTKFIKKSSIFFSLAYSYKQLESRVEEIVPLCSECDPIWYNYKLSYGRVMLKTGIEF